MKFKQVCIEALTHFLPDEVVTSQAIEDQLAPVYNRLKLPFGRLEMMTGIKERRFWKPGTLPSWCAAMAGKKALAQSGMDTADIGCLIHASVCRDYLEPATAAAVHNHLGLPDTVMLFDLSNACLGFLNAMVVVGNMIETGLIKSGLIVAGENSRPLVETTIAALLHDQTITRKNIKSAFPSLTIGSGAAAALLVHSSISKTRHFLLGGDFRTSTEHHNLCQGGDLNNSENGANPLMQTDAETLLHAGCALAKRTWEDTRKTLGFCETSVKHYFCHQVGSAHRKLLFETLGIDREKDYSTYEFLGNMGSVSLPVTFSLGIKKRQIQPNDRIALLGIGSGINCMMLGIQW